MIEFQRTARQAVPSETADTGRLSDLLARTSRTFALSIPLLEAPLRDEVTIAYLLFRIADTIEDELDWSNDERARLLRLFALVLGDEDARPSTSSVLEEIAGVEVSHEGYAELMRDALFVLDAFFALDEAPRAAIAGHLVRTANGMAEQLERGESPGDIRGAQDYCYTVAGIVGELCTELFVARNAPLKGVSRELASRAPAFGEGLQLVNILRDETADEIAGRRYIPRRGSRAELMDLARSDLNAAADYVRLLETGGASPGTVAFNALNVALAFETLALVASRGAGAKLGRPAVEALFGEILDRARDGETILPVVERAARACSF